MSMQEIILINDHSDGFMRLTEYANNLATAYSRNVVVLKREEVTEKKANQVLVKSGLGDDSAFEAPTAYLDVDSKNLIACIKAKQPWLVMVPRRLYEQNLLNHVQCPVLIFPEDTEAKTPERIAYLTDLRYAQVPVLHYLSRLDSGQENIILAHRCAAGLPELDKSYAIDLFNAICRQAPCSRIFFSQMAGGNMCDVIDRVVNGIDADMLVCVNRHFYFNEIMNCLSVPTLIFPS